MPELVKAQLESYSKKLRRAGKVSAQKQKLDPSFAAFSEKVNPLTGQPHADMSMSAKVRRINNWLKVNDRDHWNTNFRVVNDATAKPSSSGTKVPKKKSGGTTTVKDTSSKEVSYWVCVPEQSKIEIFKEEHARETPPIVEVDFSALKPSKEGDKLLSIMLEIDFIGGNLSDKGRATLLRKGVPLEVGNFLGGTFTSTNLVAGVNKVTIRAKDGSITTIDDLLKDLMVCIYRVDDTSNVFIRKWANYVQKVPNSLPVPEGKCFTIVV